MYSGRVVPNRVTARACSNIALCKYWGKLGVRRHEGESQLDWQLRSLNSPATPSISLALAALTTETTVERLPATAVEDRFELDGQSVDTRTARRLTDYLELWRRAGLLAGRLLVTSRNNFPTAAGLASSASGYAALAKALSGLLDAPLGSADLSRWARRGSGSAARSILGGIAALEATADAAAHLAVAAEETSLAMAVCIVEAPPKAVSSRAGMRQSADTSPYYSAWLASAADDYDTLIEALWRETRDDLTAAELLALSGPTVEANCIAMHAVMQTTEPSLLYWAPGTLAVMHAARGWRSSGGPQCYFTIDAGPHVALLCLRDELAAVAQHAADIPGVARVIPSLAGGPAEIISVA